MIRMGSLPLHTGHTLNTQTDEQNDETSVLTPTPVFPAPEKVDGAYLLAMHSAMDGSEM